MKEITSYRNILTTSNLCSKLIQNLVKFGSFNLLSVSV
jgi:hypothetical protein